MAEFDPNRSTFQQCAARVKEVQGATTGFPIGKITSSRDDAVLKAAKALSVSNVPGGFKKQQLPVMFDGGPGAMFFLSVGSPDVEVKSHSHDEGDGLRFIVSGSIAYDGKQLSAGDWMFIPKGQKYAFTVGPHGAVMAYCYQCCCA